MRRFSRRRRSRGRWIETNQSPLASVGFQVDANDTTMTFTPVPLNHAPLVGGVNLAGLTTGGDLKSLQHFRPRRLVGTMNYLLQRKSNEATGTWVARIFEGYAILTTDDNGEPNDTERWDEVITSPAQTADLPFVWQHYEQVVFSGTYVADANVLWNNADHNPLGNYRDLQVRRRVGPQTNLYMFHALSVSHIVAGARVDDDNWEVLVAPNLRLYCR